MPNYPRHALDWRQGVLRKVCAAFRQADAESPAVLVLWC